MIRVGITGQSGFIGTHLYNTFGLYPGEFERILFLDDFFHDDAALRKFVRQCDVIVHLSALNRHSYPKVLYDTNMRLVSQLIACMDAEKELPVSGRCWKWSYYVQAPHCKGPWAGQW